MGGNREYIQKVVYNDECILCFSDIPMHKRNQRWKLFCSRYCAQWMWKFMKQNKYHEIYPLRKGRFRTKKPEVHRY